MSISESEQLVKPPHANHFRNHLQALLQPRFLPILEAGQQLFVGKPLELFHQLLVFVDFGFLRLLGWGWRLNGLLDGLVVGGLIVGSVHGGFVGDDALDQLELFLVQDLMILVEVIVLIAGKHLVTSLTELLQAHKQRDFQTQLPLAVSINSQRSPRTLTTLSSKGSLQKLEIVGSSHPRPDLLLSRFNTARLCLCLPCRLGGFGQEGDKRLWWRSAEVPAFDYDSSELSFFDIVANGILGLLRLAEGGPKPKDLLDGPVDLLGEVSFLLLVGGRLLCPALSLLVEVELGVVDGHLLPAPELCLQPFPRPFRQLLLPLVYLADHHDRLRLSPSSTLALPLSPVLLLPLLGQAGKVIVQALLPLLPNDENFSLCLFLLRWALLLMVLVEDGAGESFVADGGGVVEGEMAFERRHFAVLGVVAVILMRRDVSDWVVGVGRAAAGFLVSRREDD